MTRPGDIPEDVWASALTAMVEALRDDRCGTAGRFAMVADTQAAFREAIARALLSERAAQIEACAKIAETGTFGSSYGADDLAGYIRGRREAAAAIRGKQ